MEYNNFLNKFTPTNLDYNKNLIELLSNSYTSEDASSVLSLLKPGQHFMGEVIDIRGQMVQIHINKEETVSAKLLDTANFVIGQKLTFQVKDKKDGVITIRPIISEEMENLPLKKILLSAGISVTGKNLNLVKTLMNEHLPVDKQTLTFYLKQMGSFPNANLKTLILMNKNDIPITSDSLNVIENYKTNEATIINEVQSLSQEIPNVILDILKESGAKAALSLQNEFLQFFMEKPVASIPPQLREELVLVFEQLKIPEDSQGLKETILNKDTSAEMIIKEITDFFDKSILPEKNNIIQKILESDSYRELFREVLLKDVLLEPKDLKEEGKLKEYYTELLEKTKDLNSVLESADKGDSKASKTVSDMNKSIHFMNTLNDTFAYIQLPLKLANQNVHGDLYVLKKKKIDQNKEEFTAMLHLDLEYLGKVNIFIKMKGKTVNSTFTLEKKDSVKLIEKNLVLLTEKLSEKGYQFITSVKEEESKNEFMDELLDQGTTDSLVKRYSFDVRT